MNLITRTIHTSEACSLLARALGAHSVQGIIEHQGDEMFASFKVEIQAGQVAYSAYRVARGGKAHDGGTLSERLSEDLLPAWEAFAAAVLSGLAVDHAYQHYLAARKGCDYSGGPAPDWDELRNNKPEIAAAWADAANALTPHP